jgi:uroporphyrinogen decarboxylase
MKPRERLLKTIKREDVDRTPVWIMRQAGRYLREYRELRERYSFAELCKNSELATIVSLLPLKYAELDAIIVFGDILLPLEPVGISVNYNRDGKPLVEGSVERLGVKWEPALFEEAEAKLSFIGETIKNIRSEKKEHAIIGFSGAPFTLLSYVIEKGGTGDFSKTRALAFKENEKWHLAMENLSELTIRYLVMQAKSGADVVQIFDSWVGWLSPYEYREFVEKYMKKIIEEVEKFVPVIHFSTGSAGILEEIASAGGSVIGVDWRISIDNAWRRVGYEKGIQGNLDPAVLLGNREDIEKGVREILKRVENKNGHIFNLGHGILPDTPVENMQFLVDLVHRLSQRE